MTSSTPSSPTDNATPAKERFPLALVLALSIGPVSFISYLIFFHLRGYYLVPVPNTVEIVGLTTIFLMLGSTALAICYLCVFGFRRGVATKFRASTVAPLIITLITFAFMIFELLPSFGHPPFVRILNNATFISEMMQYYAMEHEGHYPPHLSAFLLENPSLAGKFVASGTVTAPAIPDPPPPPTDWPKYATEVDNHTIFIYTAADLLNPSLTTANQPPLDRAIIIAYTKKLPLVPRHRIVAFPDGPAKLIPDADLPALFAASNAARAKLALPPFTLDGPPPAPPKF